MKILFIGGLRQVGTATSLRNSFISLGHDVQSISLHAIGLRGLALHKRIMLKVFGEKALLSEIRTLNKTILQLARDFQPDICLFYNLRFTQAETLAATRKIGLNVAYCVDDLFNPNNQTSDFWNVVKQLDLVFTTKSYNVPEFEDAGASKVLFVNNAYAPEFHYRVDLSPEDHTRFGGDLTFIGTFHPERADLLGKIAQEIPSININIWGSNSWKRTRLWLYYCAKQQRWRTWPRVYQSFRGGGVWGEAMSKAIQANKICLGLLYSRNRDLQTTRTMEILACGGFMLAERTDEHLALFEEDREAAYFSTTDEAIDKVQYYLAHDKERQAIAEAGYQRCLKSDYTYRDRARFVVEQVRQLN